MIIILLNFDDFVTIINKNEALILLATLFKIRKKTQKANSYAIIKFSDRQSVFEQFIFSDFLKLNRNF